MVKQKKSFTRIIEKWLKKQGFKKIETQRNDAIGTILLELENHTFETVETNVSE